MLSVGQAVGRVALVPGTLPGLYQAKMNKWMLGPLLITYLVLMLTYEGSVFIPISWAQKLRLGAFDDLQ